jgi:hypothetical protein
VIIKDRIIQLSVKSELYERLNKIAREQGIEFEVFLTQMIELGSSQKLSSLLPAKGKEPDSKNDESV